MKKYLVSSVGVTLLTVAIVVVFFLSTRKVEPQMFSSFDDFKAMSLEQLKTLQVKLTYVGAQLEPISTVAFTSPFNTLDLKKFEPFRRPGFNYSNDDSGVNTFTASPEELKALIDNVATLPDVTAGGVSDNPFLSFALWNTIGGTVKAFEAVLNQADALALFSKLRLALASNKLGKRTLSEMACPLDLLELERPKDMSANVSVEISGVRLNRQTGRFVGTAKVNNKSGQSTAGPLSIVFDLSGNVKLFNADGTTCGTSPEGREFINVSLPSGALPPGGSAQVALEFENPDKEPIRSTTKVLAGPGAR